MKPQTSALGSPTASRRRRQRRSRSGKLRLRSCGLTDTGYERPRNEDRFDLDDRRRVYVLADGIGSFKHGNVAAQIAVESILESVRSDAGPETGRELFEPAIRLAHSRICEAGRRDPTLDEMGTTLVGLLFDEAGAVDVAHAGDSRAYRLRDGELKLLTRDHTFAEEMLAGGWFDQADLESGPWAHILTRALSVQGPLEIDFVSTSARDGDVFLLCSDGLTKMLSDREIEECLELGGGPDETGRRLIDEALVRGGHDNVTVVLVEIHRPGQAEDDETGTASVEMPMVVAASAGAAPPVC
jgi:protein phosphatase